MKFHKIIFVLAVLSVFISCSKKKQDFNFLFEDIYINENLSNQNLNGHTVYVTKNNTTLSNLYNGNITVTSDVGAGTVLLKNSSIENMTVESKASIILDEVTSIKKLNIKANAKITSMKTLENKYSKNKSKTGETENNFQPAISEVEIEYGYKPLFEGGNLENVTILSKSELVISDKSETVVKKIERPVENEKTYLAADSDYSGNGVRIQIYNRPAEAEYMQIYKTSEGNYLQQIAWFDANATWDPEQIERFMKDSFIYEYLNAGREYSFIVNYLKKQGNSGSIFSIINSSKIKVIPKKGQEFTFDREKIKLRIDSETGVAEWEVSPKLDTKPGSIIQYSLNCGDWKYFGHRSRDTVSSEVYSSFNIYNDLNYIDSKLYNGIDAFISVEYKYEGFVWNIYTTETFDYDIKKAKLPW